MREDSQKSRIIERASLRHRNNSKYLQYLAKRAKYDKQSGKDVQDEIHKHRALLAKANDDDENEEAELSENEEMEEDGAKEISDKPEDFEKFNKNFKEFWIQENEMKKQKLLKKQQDLAKQRREQLEMAENIDDLFFEASKQAKKKMFNQDLELEEDSDKEKEDSEEEDESLALKTDSNESKKPVEKKNVKNKDSVVDPEKFVRTVNVQLPTFDEFDLGQEAAEDNEQDMAIAEAFADDDVGTDFRLEKKELQEGRKGKTIDLTLPGWGSWGGESIKVSKKKRRKFTVRVPPAPKRADDNKGHLIVREESAVRKHMISSLPFPFTTVADFEASMRAPIGDTFVPRSVFNKLTRPKVQTKIGSVIEAMDREELVKRGKVKQ